jgi:hypothetical protein
MSSDTVMTTAQVGEVAIALPDARVQALAASHERLRGMFEEAAVRIGKQSDLLGKRAERAEPTAPAGDLFGNQQDPSAIRR